MAQHNTRAAAYDLSVSIISDDGNTMNLNPSWFESVLHVNREENSVMAGVCSLSFICMEQFLTSRKLRLM